MCRNAFVCAKRVTRSRAHTPSGVQPRLNCGCSWSSAAPQKIERDTHDGCDAHADGNGATDAAPEVIDEQPNHDSHGKTGQQAHTQQDQRQPYSFSRCLSRVLAHGIALPIPARFDASGGQRAAPPQAKLARRDPVVIAREGHIGRGILHGPSSRPRQAKGAPLADAGARAGPQRLQGKPIAAKTTR
jgi:hypothetical protein